MKTTKPFLKKSIAQFGKIIKPKIQKLEIFKSLMLIAFKSLIINEYTDKAKRCIRLAYKALKRFDGKEIKLLRKFSIQEFSKDFQMWLQKSDSGKAKKKIVARMDTTKSGKKYGLHIPELEKLYDYVNGCYLKTHELYEFVVSIGRKDYIIDFLLVKKSNRKGWNKIAQKMANRLLRILGKYRIAFLHHARFSLDGAWGNGEMLRFLEKKGFHYTAIKSGGKDLVVYQEETLSLKALEKKLLLKDAFRPFNEKHGLKGEYSSCIVQVKKTEQKIRIVLRKFKSKKKIRTLMILSTNVNIYECYDYQIALCYAGRWGIEECIKECKQIVDLTKYSFHSEKTANIEMFLVLRLICYMILNWYRVGYCKPSKTSMWKVAEKFKQDFNAMGFRSIWYLFSG